MRLLRLALLLWQDSIARLSGTVNNRVLATKAMRRASNAGQMLDAIAKSTSGLGVYNLDPTVGTLCGAVMGSRRSFEAIPSPGTLFLDLGGGSAQMTWIDASNTDHPNQAADAGVSLPFGAARLMRVLKDDEASVRTKRIETLSDGLVMAFGSLCR
jgi:retrograde regulation protein 2